MDTAQFFALVDSSGDGCWPWTGRIDKDGYGRYGRQLAHKVAFKIANPDVDRTLSIDHTCYNRACCRPSHLEAVTMEVNLKRRRLRLG